MRKQLPSYSQCHRHQPGFVTAGVGKNVENRNNDDVLEMNKRKRDDRFLFLQCGTGRCWTTNSQRSRKRIILYALAVLFLELGISCLVRFIDAHRRGPLLTANSPVHEELRRPPPPPPPPPQGITHTLDETKGFLVMNEVWQQQHQQQHQRQQPESTATRASVSFMATPNASQRIACIAKSQAAVIRAFRQRGWDVIPCADTHSSRHKEMRKCTRGSTPLGNRGTLLWTKHAPTDSLWNMSQPWQRHNWIPYQSIMSSKGKLLRALKRYSRRTKRRLLFLPDSYVLPLHLKSLLARMLGTGSNNDDENEGKNVTLTTTGLEEPWVLKLGGTDNGVGVIILGPNSDGFDTFVSLLQSSRRAYDIMPQIREQLIFAPQVNDTRTSSQIEKARRRSRQDDIVIQRYVQNELNYNGHKFDLRVFYLIASADPLIVFYHDGTLRVALPEYNETDFSSTGSHLTNIGRNRAIDNCTASFVDWEVMLQAHVAANPDSFCETVRKDPLQHVRKQLMDALASVIASVRDTAFGGHGGSFTHTENGFALMGGDFIVDRDLNVWLTEAQSSPGLGHETETRKELYDRLLPSVVDILDEILNKQAAGKSLFPIENTGDFELIYTDGFQYQYDFPRREQRGPC